MYMLCISWPSMAKFRHQNRVSHDPNKTRSSTMIWLYTYIRSWPSGAGPRWRSFDQRHVDIHLKKRVQGHSPDKLTHHGVERNFGPGATPNNCD